jgi:hypothetical protein
VLTRPPRSAKAAGPSWNLLRLGWAKEGRAVGVLAVWIWWERLLAWRQRIRPVREDGILRYSLSRHRGRRVVLRDGRVIERGDRIVELHFDNRRLVEVSAVRTGPWGLLRRLPEDLAALQRLLATGQLGEVRALHGVTLFAAAGPRLGFEVRPLRRSRYMALQHFFMAGLVVLYHPEGWRVAQRQRARLPGEVWMSLGALNDRFGAVTPPTAGADPRRPKRPARSRPSARR